MRILLIGSGGREHAFSWKLSQSPLCTQLFIAPGNAGTALCGTNISIPATDFSGLGDFCREKQIGLVIVGPEEPLVKGLRDHFERDEVLCLIPFVGPDAKGARLEGSKDFSKSFMLKYGIPAAQSQTFTPETFGEGEEYIRHHSLPIVLKADGLAAGKGVVICQSHEEALDEFHSFVKESRFGEAGKKVLVEQFLSGIELSVFVLCDGENYKILPPAKDYKRIGEADTGPNTGGMGAVSPVPFADDDFMEKVESRIIRPTIAGLRQEGISYKGFIFIGLMKVDGDPMMIEYNCRMGDPETEVVLPRIKSDLVNLMMACATGRLDTLTLETDPRYAATIMLVSQGYPGDYAKGKVITESENIEDSMVFHAGTNRNSKNELVSNGGRVIAVTSYGHQLDEAVKISLRNAERINFEGKYFRTDIGYEFMLAE